MRVSWPTAAFVIFACFLFANPARSAQSRPSATGSAADEPLEVLAADQQVEQAARRYRISAYNAFHANRRQYDYRLRILRKTLSDWQSTTNREEYLDEIIDWLQQATRGQKSHPPGPLPKRPTFAAETISRPARPSRPSLPAVEKPARVVPQIPRPQQPPKKPPVVKRPVAKPPVAKPPVVKRPVAKPPVVKRPVAKPPVAKPPVAKPPVVKRPVAKPPVAKPPAVKPPAVKPPVVKRPVAKRPVAKPPAVKLPTLELPPELQRQPIVSKQKKPQKSTAARRPIAPPPVTPKMKRTAKTSSAKTPAKPKAKKHLAPPRKKQSEQPRSVITLPTLSKRELSSLPHKTASIKNKPRPTRSPLRQSSDAKETRSLPDNQSGQKPSSRPKQVTKLPGLSASDTSVPQKTGASAAPTAASEDDSNSDVNLIELAAQIAGTNMALRGVETQLAKSNYWDSSQLEQIVGMLKQLDARQEDISLVCALLPKNDRRLVGQLESMRSVISACSERISETKARLKKKSSRSNKKLIQAELEKLDELSQQLSKMQAGF